MQSYTLWIFYIGSAYMSIALYPAIGIRRCLPRQEVKHNFYYGRGKNNTPVGFVNSSVVLPLRQLPARRTSVVEISELLTFGSARHFYSKLFSRHEVFPNLNPGNKSG